MILLNLNIILFTYYLNPSTIVIDYTAKYLPTNSSVNSGIGPVAIT